MAMTETVRIGSDTALRQRLMSESRGGVEMPVKILEWLAAHGKGDLFECTWGEIVECLREAGYGCPMAEGMIEHSQGN